MHSARPIIAEMANGLDDVVATSTRLSDVDGNAGRLILAGYPVEDLAPFASFEEVAYLFLHGRLPTAPERTAFSGELVARRRLPSPALDVLKAAAAARASVMDALRMASALIGLGRCDDPLDEALTAIASFPTIVGTYWRLKNGETPLPVREELHYASHYFYQLFGAEPSADRSRGLETYLNTAVDHGLNASTFAA